METSEGLGIALAITAAIFVMEVIGGVLTNSLALLSDAGHVFSDSLALLTAFFACILAKKAATKKRTFGYHRAEVFAALFNGILLVVFCAAIFLEAYRRLVTPFSLNAPAALAVASVGLGGNLLMFFLLRKEKSLNVRSAVMHIIGDTLASVGVVVGTLLIMATGIVLFDPLVSFVIGAIVLFGAYRVTREALHILSESTPYGLNVQGVCDAMCGVRGVVEVYDIHAWNICSEMASVTAHVVVKDVRVSKTKEIAMALQKRLAGMGITHTCFQFESGKVKKKVCNICH